MKPNSSTLGNQGEEIAAQHLCSKGYKLLHRNWRYKYREVDLIFQKNHLLIFVEVKTRTGNGYGSPEDFVDRAKERGLEEASLEYIHRYNHQGEIRFDIVSILFQKGKYLIKHIEDAFFPGS